MNRTEAATKGEPFFQGRPCKRCGGTLRYTSNRNCVPCQKMHAERDHQAVRDLLSQSRS